jgi:hypothetical protein
LERELVLRLASLLWRLRRIISIETDLLKMQSDIVRERRAAFRDSGTRSPLSVFHPPGGRRRRDTTLRLAHVGPRLHLLLLRLSNNGAFERLGRYNAALWKQTAQTLFLLHSIRRG